MKWVVVNISGRNSTGGGSSVSLGGKVIRPGRSVTFDSLPPNAHTLEKAKFVSVRQIDKSPPDVVMPREQTQKKKRRRRQSSTETTQQETLIREYEPESTDSE